MSLNIESLEFLAHKKCFLFDLDGTLHHGGKAIIGAIDLLRALEARGIRYLLFTNNSSRDHQTIADRLRALGFDTVRSDQIIVATDSVITLMQEQRFKRAFTVATPAVNKIISEAGTEIVNHQSSADFCSSLNSQLSIDAQFDRLNSEIVNSIASTLDIVIVAADRELTFERLALACQLISRGVPYVQVNPDLFCPTDRGPEVDCGAIVAAIRATTGIDPQWIMGKPSRAMLDIALSKASAKPEEIVIVGDRLLVDIQCGVSAGIDTILVRSGDAQTDSSGQIVPTATLDSVATILGFFENQRPT